VTHAHSRPPTPPPSQDAACGQACRDRATKPGWRQEAHFKQRENEVSKNPTIRVCQRAAMVCVCVCVCVFECVCVCVCGSHARGAFACQSSNHPPIPPSPSPPPSTRTTQPRMPSSTHICSLRISARHRPSCLYFLPCGCPRGVCAWAECRSLELARRRR
jgi:hypothetical protein